MESLAEHALRGFQATTSDGLRISVHSMLASHDANISKVEDLLALKQVSSTTSPCHRGFINRVDLINAVWEAPRTFCHTMEVMEEK